MALIKLNNKFLKLNSKFEVLYPAAPVPDKIDMINSADGVSFSSLPDITGAKVISTRMYIPTSTTFFRLVWSASPSTDYLRIDHGLGEFGSALMIEVNYSANRRQYDLGSEGLLGVPFTLEISKGTGTIVYVKFNGNVGTDLGSALQFGPSNQHMFQGSGHASIWNLTIQGTHQWIGYPYGNTDGAWIDMIGNCNGTITNTPGTINLTT